MIAANQQGDGKGYVVQTATATAISTQRMASSRLWRL
jgi:hypothetical protein